MSMPLSFTKGYSGHFISDFRFQSSKVRLIASGALKKAVRGVRLIDLIGILNIRRKDPMTHLGL